MSSNSPYTPIPPQPSPGQENQPPVMQYHTPGTGIPCPKCGGTLSKPVTFSWWGGVLGPKMLSHVKCTNCGAGFNGKTGRSNNTAIAIYVIVSGILGLVLVYFFIRR